MKRKSINSISEILRSSQIAEGLKVNPVSTSRNIVNKIKDGYAISVPIDEYDKITRGYIGKDLLENRFCKLNFNYIKSNESNLWRFDDLEFYLLGEERKEFLENNSLAKIESASKEILLYAERLSNILNANLISTKEHTTIEDYRLNVLEDLGYARNGKNIFVKNIVNE